MTDPTKQQAVEEQVLKEAERLARDEYAFRYSSCVDFDPHGDYALMFKLAYKAGFLKAWHLARAEAFEKFCNDLLYEFEPRSANSEAEAEVCEWLESYIERAKAEALK